MANRDNFRNRAAACEAHDDIPRSPRPWRDDRRRHLEALQPPRDDARNARCRRHSLLVRAASSSRKQSEGRSVSRSLPVRGGRGRRRHRPPRRRRLQGAALAQMGRQALPGFLAVRSAHAIRNRTAQAVRIQQRLHRLFPDRRQQQPWAALRQSRIHERGADVPGLEGTSGYDRLQGHDGGAGRHRDGGARRHRGRDRARPRGLGDRARQPL